MMNDHNDVSSDEQSLYGLLPTFMGVPPVRNIEQSDADVVVSGVPFDLATSGRPGARLGPKGIRLASANLAWEEYRWPWQFAVQDELKVADYGDVWFKYGEPAMLVENLTAHAQRLLENDKTMLTFGGDHFITLPVLRAHAEKHGPLSLIHFDAHTDTYSEGGAIDHGTMFHHAMVEGLVNPEYSVQIGIRTSYDAENHKYNVLDAAWVDQHGAEATLERIREIVGDRKTYLTFDIDCLDPAFAPGTGTPVSGGLSTTAALRIVRGMVGIDLVGMDVVEVSPSYDHAEVTALAGATLALEMLYVLAANKRQKQLP
ncbi:agmatinase [Amphritea sp. 1_MG-2023]|uniref:agmatinase n=1 Tax=Amphritea sp. 1_MG-2023 TaxID=3062670 RepID=UPI0026E4607E|nr:agmatinase [Amphritea sp. 1_MG-2023]MDO6563391.1 agmatinase [Amphritea sp. 1_MG-2023]